MRPDRELKAEQRLIVALDVPSRAEADRLVAELDGVVSFYKIGLILLMAGGIESLIRDLVKRGRVFLDLKLPDDITQTVRRAVEVSSDLGISFLTLSNSVSGRTIQAAVEGRGRSENPQLLFVPLVSSMNEKDLEAAGAGGDLKNFIINRAARALDAGCDGLIASGDAIGMLRKLHPQAPIVSPGIRPKGFGSDDHKRLTTPGEAIAMGADYLVVGRPITRPPEGRTPADVARAIIGEIGSALASGGD